MLRRSTWLATAAFPSTSSPFAKKATSSARSSAKTSARSSPMTCRSSPPPERFAMIQDVIRDIQHWMHGAIEALHREFKTLRTGRANVSMLDGIVIEYYGTPTPLAQVASLKVPEPSLIVAEPWDKSMVAPIEKAIRNSDLGLNPANDGKVVRIPIPQLTEDRRKELVKRAHHVAEESRTA